MLTFLKKVTVLLGSVVIVSGGVLSWKYKDTVSEWTKSVYSTISNTISEAISKKEENTEIKIETNDDEIAMQKIVVETEEN